MAQSPDRSKMPELQEVNWVNFPVIHSLRLDNGIPLYVIPFGKQEVSEVRLVFKKGKFLEHISGQASFASALLTEGTRNLSAFEFAEQMDFFGAVINAESGYDYSSLSLSTLRKHLPPTLELMRDAAFFPKFAGSEFELFKSRRLQSLEIDEKQTGFVARREFNKLLFGPRHPYGSQAGMVELNALALNDVKAFHASVYNSKNCFLVASGMMDPETMRNEMNTVFGTHDIPLDIQSAAPEIPEAILAHGYHFFPMKDTTQATVRVGHSGFGRSHPDYYPMQVVNTILGGYFGSRLMENIREQKGYTYGIGSGWVCMKNDGLFIIQTDCGNQYVEDVRKEIRKELNLLIAEGVDEKELGLVKNYILGNSISSRETPAKVSEYVCTALVLGIPLDRLDEKYDAIRSITPAKIKEAAATHLHPEKLLEVVCGAG